MSRSPDLISIVEAAYRTDLDERAWLSNVSAEADKVIGRGLGTGGWFIDASNLADVRMWGFENSHLRCPVDLAAAAANATPADFQAYFTKQAVGTGSGQLGVKAWKESAPRAFYQAAGAADTLGVVAIDPNLTGCVLCVPLPEITQLARHEVRVLLRVAAHLTAGHRVRASIAGRPLEQNAEAILRPDGKIEHAEEPASSPRARAALRRLALEVDRARTSLRRDEPDRALEVWTALVSGRWTLLDHFDTDGRRYLVARRNEPHVAEPLALTERERQVVALTAQGHPGKLISYELGLSQPTVALHLGTAMSKLGVRSRAELVALLARAAVAAAG